MEILEGVVVNGGIVLEPPRSLPDGTRVKVSLETPRARRMTVSEVIDQAIERRRFIGGRNKEEIDAELAEIEDDAETEIAANERRGDHSSNTSDRQ